MTGDRLMLYEAFDKMIRVLGIEAKEICDLSGVSQSRVSSFRKGTKKNMGTDFLDALLDAATSVNPRARELFASYIGGKSKLIEDMTLAEKGELMIALGKSVQSQSSVSTDTETTKTA